MLVVSHDEIDLAAEESLSNEKVQEFLLALSLANTIFVEHSDKDILIIYYKTYSFILNLFFS